MVSCIRQAALQVKQCHPYCREWPSPVLVTAVGRPLAGACCGL